MMSTTRRYELSISSREEANIFFIPKFRLDLPFRELHIWTSHVFYAPSQLIATHPQLILNSLYFTFFTPLLLLKK